ncbi:hypothetical protein [Caballeronia sp. BR00000012568055]|uniref:hypothetical protein n=1 Tax=Caballeronia sp. BR00000012568055 TaxID=2918761 RepID=UPI0023F86AFB|nr:hypothetical protein [Caballeronia sp. BR00000012568055]
MSSLIFFEVAQQGHDRFVDMGKISVRDAIAPRRAHGVRLCFYVRDEDRQTRFRYELLRQFQAMLPLVANPHSSVREGLYDHADAVRRFFSAPSADATQFASVAEDDVRMWLKSKDSVVVEADGKYAELVELLDALCDNEPANGPARAPDPEQAAIDFRNQLLAKNWRDGKGVAALLGMATEVANPNQYAYRLRKDGALFGVWSAKDRGYRYPDFQFERGMLRPETAELLSVLAALEDSGGWRIAFWLYSPHALLDGNKPADVFVTAAQRVIDVARQEFGGEQDAGW